MDPSLLMTVLAQGEEQARQLKAQLDGPQADAEWCKSKARQIQSSFETAIMMANHLGGGSGAGTSNVGSDSGGSESPWSENSDGGLKDHEHMETMYKKRKGMTKWSSQVRVSNLGGGIEGSLDDGYSWRKYGQKDILGAKYPRGYYRCTNRNSQGCLATKQVQRSDADPTILDVSYREVHTCVQKPHKVQVSPKRARYNLPDSGHHAQLHQEEQQQQQLMSLRANLKVETEGLDAIANGGQQAYVASSLSFSFPPTPVSCIQAQSSMFLSPSVQDNQFAEEFSPAFMSATTWPNVHSSDSGLTGIISAATSATNSPMVDIDFSQFDPNFPFDSSRFF